VVLVAGLIFGALGFAWSRKGSRIAATAVAAVFLLEPLVHVAGDRYTLRPLNLAIWSAEGLIGIAVLAWIWLRAQPRASASQTSHSVIARAAEVEPRDLQRGDP
jgi:hypothetical protein